jgi:hypothetical protein
MEMRAKFTPKIEVEGGHSMMLTEVGRQLAENS